MPPQGPLSPQSGPRIRGWRGSSLRDRRLEEVLLGFCRRAGRHFIISCPLLGVRLWHLFVAAEGLGFGWRVSALRPSFRFFLPFPPRLGRIGHLPESCSQIGRMWEVVLSLNQMPSIVRNQICLTPIPTDGWPPFARKPYQRCSAEQGAAH